MEDYAPIELTTILEPRREWHPIDTAPTDGTRVLLRCLDGEPDDRSAHRSVSIGRWDRHEVFGVPSPDWYDDSGSYLEPDGWMPLPAVE
ncbi:MAG: hypothetical protein ACRC62_34915 [Microcoleus sp.]